jgi:tetratricopeptide (TPR) repeat protein
MKGSRGEPSGIRRGFRILPGLLVGVLGWLSVSCAFQGAASAEEYFSLGTAYFELGKYEEAEKWFNRAKSADKTRTASEYNLGRIAFETGRYGDAVKIFDKILEKDPDNVMALKAAAYTRIKLGELDKAEAIYDRVLRLEPESADEGYNYALVLFALEKPARAEEVLARYPFALDENDAALLLLARLQRAQHKVEAANSYEKWLRNNTDPQVRYEYAQVLEGAEFYVRALEEYRALLALPQDTSGPSRPSVRYALARLLLIADGESGEGVTELRAAVSEGFSDAEALNGLLADDRISAAHKEEIRRIISSKGDVEGGADGSQEG